MKFVLSAFAMLLVIGAHADDKPKADDKANKQEKLDTAIAECIRLLEAKEYAAVLKQFTTPDDFKKITKSQTLDEAAKDFADGKAAKLLEILKSLKDAKPKLSDDGNEATYELKKEISSREKITFVKIEKLWRIKD